ncbi:MAG TPA: DUF4912 domain-containing protein [Pyrinomonadaceae bacterium]|nr:DUF4912 domain-containing protein [Pyrinomonadaceae bacterium]
MNDSDKKNSKVKAEKTTKKVKVVDEIKVEAKSKVAATKKITAKIEAEATPKVKKAVAKTPVEVAPKSKTTTKTEKVEVVEAAPKVQKATAKTEKVAVAKAETEIEPKATKSKTKVKADEVVEVKAETKAKKSAAKTEKVVVAKAKKSKAEKVVAEAETEPEKLPLAAKIQTLENFDLAETEVETEELSPVFKALAEPKLPTLREENRAFLQIQSPTRVFFYWSLKQDSYNTLRRALGTRADDYFLAIRLTNLSTNKDEIHQVGNKGSWWFNNIEADSKYRAEVGFYAQGRPFVRIVFSNTLETPRQKPSENVAYQPYFAVSAEQFAEVLDSAGFSQDAFEVYLAGDEPQFADEATQKAFVQLVGTAQIDFSNIDVNELRYVLFALASGVSLFSLRDQLSGNLFEFLAALIDENPNALTEEKVILALEEFFGVSPLDEEIEEEFGAPTVFGASLINFPKQLRKKTSKFSPKGKLNPLSSFSLK